MFVLSILESVAEGVVSKTASLATDQLRLDIVCCFRKELEKLNSSLEGIGNLRHDAARQIDGRQLQAMAGWMRELIRIAYDAEDVLDEVQYEEDRIRIEETSLDKKILGFFCNNPLLFRLQMARKIYNINISLKNLNEKASGVALVSRSNGGAEASQVMQSRETTPFFEKDVKIVERVEIESKIIAALTTNFKEFSVMAVVGLPGVGKTTLARSVTKQVKEGGLAKHFDTTLWVYVSNTFDVNSILRGMVESYEATTATTRTALIQSLQNKLTNKRVFLVLDDVWNEERTQWEDLRSCLLQLNFAEGSTVIVTSRSRRVASTMEADPCWNLETLSVEECWSIMKNRAFGNSNDSLVSELEEVGRDLAKKCAGLPLAAKVLGSRLRSKTSKKEWMSILESKIWQSSGEIMPVLMLSFDNLKPPVPLKQCFAYCSMFKRGSYISKDELIQLWMAQGLLHHSQVHSEPIEMEDIGERYFNTLVINSLFQDAIKDEDGVITGCSMHDLVHELAIEVSMCESWTADFRSEMDDPDMIRHVARIPTSALERMRETSIIRLRSLFSDDEVSNIIFPKLEGLRALSLYGPVTQELRGDSFGKMKHLRYLDLSNTEMKVVPQSIGKLYNLQTLRLPPLKECPVGIQHLINLRSLYFDETMKFQAGILGRLTNLRILPVFNVDKEGGPTIGELGGLKQLRGSLIIGKLEDVRDGERQESFLKGEESLRCANIEMGDRRCAT